MDVDDAAERIYEKIEIYMDTSGDRVTELTDEEQKKILIGVLKVFIKEIATLATVAALVQTKRAVDSAMKDHLKRVATDANELYERMKRDGHL